MRISGRQWWNNPTAVGSALTDAVRELMELGETAVVEQLYKGHGLQTGHYRRSIHGQLHGRFSAEVNDSGVVYGPWLEGVGSRNATTRFKGYAMFRRAHQRVERATTPTVTKALQRHLGA